MTELAPVIEAPTTDEMRVMIRESIAEIIPEHLSDVVRTKDIVELNQTLQDIKTQLAKTATNDDIKDLHKRIDIAETNISASQNDHRRLVARVDEAEHERHLFEKFIKDSVSQMERHLASAIEAMNSRDKQYHERVQALDERVTITERMNNAQSEAIKTLEVDQADMRARHLESFPPLQRIVFGDKDTNRPGILTQLETVKTTLNDTNAALALQFNGLSASLAPMIANHQAQEARKARWQARKRFIASVLLSRQGLAFISAAVVVTAPIVIRWIQTNINLNPTIAGILNQIVIALNFYAGK